MSWWDHLHWADSTWLSSLGNDNWNSSKLLDCCKSFLHETNDITCLSNSHWRNVRLSRASPLKTECLSVTISPLGLDQSPWCKPQNSLRSCQWTCYPRRRIQYGTAGKFKEFWTSSQTLSGLPEPSNSFFLSLLFQCLEVLTQKIKNVEVLRLYRTANKISPRRSPWWINTWLSFAQLCKSAFKVIQANLHGHETHGLTALQS